MSNTTEQQTVNIISAEQDNAFHKLDVNNIVVELPKNIPAPVQKGVWVNIKYRYGNGKKEKLDKLKIQTSELFSYGVSKYEETSPAKMSFAMINRKQREAVANGDEISEDEQTDIKVEDDTVHMLDEITEKLKEAMKDPEMIKALGKQRDKKWGTNVDSMEITKRKEQENGIDAVYVYAKVVESNNFMKTKFHLIDECEEEGIKELNQKDTVDRLIQKDVNCRATAMFVIDSVFVGKEPYIQMKLSEAIISEFVEFKSKRNIILPTRFRNKSFEKKPKAKLYDSDSDSENREQPKNKKIISQTKDGSDSDSD